MPDYCEFVEEPRDRRRKYRIHAQKRKRKWDAARRHWTVLLSVTPLEVFYEETESPSPSPLAGSGPGGHKPSFKSTKLAKRARSFKDDFLEKISQMRSPTTLGVRAQSPKGRAIKSDAVDTTYNKGPIQELDHLFKQIKIALKHFRDVVSKKKLEMLPGNGTIVLDTIWAINLTVQRSTVCPESSSSITSATHHMYQSVAKLIKLCDDALIDDQSAVLDEGNVEEVVALVEESVESLIKLVQEKITSQPKVTSYKTTPRTTYGMTNLDMPAQRNSLPDIPLTERERQIIEQNSRTPCMVRNSHSSESILRDSSPPPKPPLPHNVYRKDQESFMTPPPLPPKKRNLENNYVVCFNSDNSIFTSSLERMSLRSKSPEDSSSLLSASAGSLDSVLNNSRDEEEIRAIMDQNTDCDALIDNDPSDLVAANGSYSWDDSFMNSTQDSFLNQSNDLHLNNIEYNRLSNTDSGFVSVHSHRNSSYSKRSSQQSSVSSQWSSHQMSMKQSSEFHKAESVAESQTFIKNVQTVMQKSCVTLNSSSNQISFATSGDEVDSSLFDDSVPPAIPLKTKRKQERQPSPYDNVPDSNNFGGELLVTCQLHQSHQSMLSSASILSMNPDSNRPPPLPPKKKHMFQSVAYSVMAYMEMFGNCSHSNDQEFMRHSVHVQGHWVQPSKIGLPTTQSCSFSHTSSSSRSSQAHVQTLTLPYSSGDSSPIPSPMRSPNSSAVTPVNTSSVPPALPPKRSRSSSAKSSPPATPQAAIILEMKSPVKSLPDLLEHTTNNNNLVSTKPTDETPESSDSNICDIDLMEETDIMKYLLFKVDDDDGPEIRGGCIDSLIIQATKATKNGVFAYQEAFLTTYRTFITPFDLISKLIRRFTHFYCQPDKKPKEAFALIIRVVSDLTASDLDNELQQMLMDFVQQLISCGEITLAKALRVKHLERHDAKQLSIRLAGMQSISSKQSIYTLLDFKSEQIAEQMTFLDAELFMKIEIPEVLIWAQEQNEERSPNLTKFTEHFNKMSYWARTRILQAEAKDREKYFVKFIKIMKHLRKINNFNSYLALLSALDSAPIRRLEWQRHIQEGLKEYCALIDSSSSFRAYRQALADTQPPCIPYIGLVLQDLTFVHIGNSNLLQNGFINFSKRWQQYNIVENMKRFKKCAYSFKRNDRIIEFFKNFDDHICEDAMWQLSETIKPRGKKQTQQ